jgi:hypothetical protein
MKGHKIGNLKRNVNLDVECAFHSVVQDKQRSGIRSSCSLLRSERTALLSIMLAAIAGPCGFVYGGAATTSCSGTGGTGYRRSNGGVSLLSVTRRCHEEMVKKRSGLWLLRRWLLSSSSGRSDTRRATGRGLLLLPAVHACSLNNTLTAADGQGCTVQSRKQEHESSIDLKEWMHEQGLPECKVALAEASPWDNDVGGGKSKPIHYVVASEELRVRER